MENFGREDALRVLLLLTVAIGLATATDCSAEELTAEWFHYTGYWTDYDGWDVGQYPDHDHPEPGSIWRAEITGNRIVVLDKDIRLNTLALGLGEEEHVPYVRGGHTLTVDDVFHWNRGTLDFGITVNVNGGMEFFSQWPADQRRLKDATLNHRGQTVFNLDPGDDWWGRVKTSGVVGPPPPDIYLGESFLTLDNATFNNEGSMVFLFPWSFRGNADGEPADAVFTNSGSMSFKSLTDEWGWDKYNMGRSFRNLTLNNSGSITYESSDTFISDVVLYNSGTITVDRGRVHLQDGGETSGKLEIRGSGRLVVNDYAFTETSELIVGGGSGRPFVQIERGVTTIAGTYDIAHMELHGKWPGDPGPDAEVHFDGDGLLRSVWLQEGVLTGSGTVITDWVPWLGGTMAGTGITLNRGDIVMSPDEWEDAPPLFLQRTIVNEGWIGFTRFDWRGAVGDIEMTDGAIDNHEVFRAGFQEGDSRIFSGGGDNYIYNHADGRFVVDIGVDQELWTGERSVLTIDEGVRLINDGELRVERGILRVLGGYEHGETGSVTLGTVTSEGGLEADTIEVRGRLGGRGTVRADVMIGHGHIYARTAPGSSAGQLVIDGDYTQQAGVLEIELGGVIFDEQTQQYDRLTVTGEALLGAAAIVEVLLIDQFYDDYQPLINDAFDVVVADSIIVDQAITFNWPELQPGLVFRPEVVGLISGEQALRITVVPEPTTVALLALGGLALIRRRGT